MAERTKPTAAGDDLQLPPEICREILTRLPVKSILRFRSVCKSWYSLVSCPSFISSYSVRNLNKNGDRVLLHLWPSIEVWYSGVHSFISHDKSFMESREHNEIPESFLDSYTSIVGSCNGLICLKACPSTNHRVRRLVIWNPTIRKIVELQSPTYARDDSWRVCGFGFDSETSDYKVLSCYIPVNHDSRDVVFQIFDLRKGVWRDIGPHYPSSLHVVRRSPDCYLDGVVHWDWDEGGILVSFDFSDECFWRIHLPDSVKFGYNLDDDNDSSRVIFKSVTFGGLIHVIVFSKMDNGPIVTTKNCSIWAMKEYGVTKSWTKVYDIDLERAQVLSKNILNPYQFLLWENDEVLMVLGLESGEELVLYNIRSRKSKCVISFARPELDCSFASRIRSMRVYGESLVLM